MTLGWARKCAYSTYCSLLSPMCLVPRPAPSTQSSLQALTCCLHHWLQFLFCALCPNCLDAAQRSVPAGLLPLCACHPSPRDLTGSAFRWSGILYRHGASLSLGFPCVDRVKQRASAPELGMSLVVLLGQVACIFMAPELKNLTL